MDEEIVNRWMAIIHDTMKNNDGKEVRLTLPCRAQKRRILAVVVKQLEEQGVKVTVVRSTRQTQLLE